MNDCDQELGQSISSIIIGFAQDEQGDWFVELACGHTQHLRHQPPWQNRAWVQDQAQRLAAIGQRFSCGWCNKEDKL